MALAQARQASGLGASCWASQRVRLERDTPAMAASSRMDRPASARSSLARPVRKALRTWETRTMSTPLDASPQTARHQPFVRLPSDPVLAHTRPVGPGLTHPYET